MGGFMAKLQIVADASDTALVIGLEFRGCAMD
jgi:hypothetical protein